MQVRSSFPIIYVDDVPASVRFYGDLLGFEEMYRFPDTDQPGYVALRLDEGKIGLSSAEFVLRLRNARVTVLAEPADQVWGERVAYVEDPDGNPVHIRGPALTPEPRSE